MAEPSANPSTTSSLILSAANGQGRISIRRFAEIDKNRSSSFTWKASSSPYPLVADRFREKVVLAWIFPFSCDATRARLHLVERSQRDKRHGREKREEEEEEEEEEEDER
ncbi:hypothetical protein K0M31_013550 [Melipona bicolor]|uniref:Uncharacterized protein n=1 Tax=Melipona bicolor TaxID=60889 RepID=A0AA40FHV4_9HYME|nr:hypothetical protein K0M31_013550 [Melipona bicolor]